MVTSKRPSEILGTIACFAHWPTADLLNTSHREEEEGGGDGRFKARHFADDGADVRLSELTNVRFRSSVNGSFVHSRGTRGGCESVVSRLCSVINHQSWLSVDNLEWAPLLEPYFPEQKKRCVRSGSFLASFAQCFCTDPSGKESIEEDCGKRSHIAIVVLKMPLRMNISVCSDFDGSASSFHWRHFGVWPHTHDSLCEDKNKSMVAVSLFKNSVRLLLLKPF